MRSSKYVVYITCRSFITFQKQISNLNHVLKKTNNDFIKVRTINRSPINYLSLYAFVTATALILAQNFLF